MENKKPTKEEIKRELNKFDAPLDLEWRIMEQLYKKQKQGNNFVQVVEMYNILGIRDGYDIGAIYESQFLSIELDNTHECFRLTKDGEDYMNGFYALVLWQYRELGGLVTNYEMVNRDKCARAKQAVKDFLKDKSVYISNSRENSKGLVEGVEIYARNIINNGVITSDSKTKVIADNYKGVGEVSSFSKGSGKEKWHQKWWGKMIITIIAGLIVAFLVYKFGLNK